MRKYVVSAVTALALALPGAAFAASAATPAPAAATTSSTQADQLISSTVKSFDLKARTLVLADGTSYELPLDFKDPGLKIGEKVTVHWKHSGAMNEVTSVTIG